MRYESAIRGVEYGPRTDIVTLSEGMSMYSWDAIRKLGEEVGTLADLSRKCGYDKTHFYVLCNGKYDSKASTLSKAAEAAGKKLCICKKPPKDAIIIDHKED